MTNAEMIQELVTNLQAEGRDPMFIVGYLESFLVQVVEDSSKKRQSQVHSYLVRRLNARKNNA